jgi:hypothetical protein
MKLKTQVGAYSVEVMDAHKAAIVYFKSGAHGTKEAGYFAFWTAVLKTGKKRRIWGRASVGLSAGDRMDRMQFEMHESKDPDDRRIYGRFWTQLLRRGKNICFIRPSTKAEIAKWMRGHVSDAVHAYHITVSRRVSY